MIQHTLLFIATLLAEQLRVDGFKSPQLFDSNFEHVTQAATGQTTGVWVVKFCSTASEECRQLQPVWEPLVEEMRQEQVFLAVVDIEKNPKLVKRFHISRLPTILLFRERKMFVFPVTAFGGEDVGPALRLFVTRGYETALSQEVPPEVTSLGEVFQALRSHVGIVGILLAALSVVGIVLAGGSAVVKAKKD